jgi:hypothetical protein
MNALIKKIFAVGSILLLSACAHYSGAYYPDSVSYGGGYTVIERDYYRSMPDYGHRHYSSGGDHFHDVYRPRRQAEYGRAPHEHYYPDQRPHADSHRWEQPHWQHEDHRAHREDRRMPGPTAQPKFRDDNHQRHWPSIERTAPAGGRFNPGQFGGARDNHSRQYENRGPRQGEHRGPGHAEQQGRWNGNRQQHGNRGDGRSHQHGRYE